jgi:hypothetical protein
LFSLYRYLFSSEIIFNNDYYGFELRRRDLAGKESKLISSEGHYALDLDYQERRVFLFISWGSVGSLDYDGGEISYIFSDRSLHPGVFSQIGSSMYFRKDTSPVIVEKNTTSRKISRYVRFTDRYPMRLAVVDKSLQSEGRFYMSNKDFKDVVNPICTGDFSC